MLDIYEEIKKYKKIQIEHKEFKHYYDTEDYTRLIHKQYLNEYLSEIKKISKGQFRVSQRLDVFYDEITEALSEQSKTIMALENSIIGKNEEINRLKSEKLKQEQVWDDTVTTLINIVDLINNMYISIVKTENLKWKGQLKLLMKMVDDHMLSAGIVRVQSVGMFFIDKLHLAVDTVNNNGKNDYEIIEEVSPGYIYGDKVLRKAKVVVNKKLLLEE